MYHIQKVIVGGLETEYTGAKLAFLHLTRDVHWFWFSLVVALFRGPNGPVFFGLDWLFGSMVCSKTISSCTNQ